MFKQYWKRDLILFLLIFLLFAVLGVGSPRPKQVALRILPDKQYVDATTKDIQVWTEPVITPLLRWRTLSGTAPTQGILLCQEEKNAAEILFDREKQIVVPTHRLFLQCENGVRLVLSGVVLSLDQR